MVAVVTAFSRVAELESQCITRALRRRDSEFIGRIVSQYHYRLLRYLVYWTSKARDDQLRSGTSLNYGGVGTSDLRLPGGGVRLTRFAIALAPAKNTRPITEFFSTAGYLKMKVWLVIVSFS